jgi:trimeric autotransporter adhesin
MKMKMYGVLFTGAAALLHGLDGYSQANTTLSNLVAPTAVNQSLLPNTANTRDLGSAARRWRLFYFDSAIYMKTVLTIHARGTGNFFAGQQSGNLTLTGNSNSGFGQLALNKLTSGVNNAATGYKALYATTSGNSNTAAGREAAVNTTTGSFNTALGFQSLFTNTTGAYNTVAGFQAAYFNKTGYSNIAIGPKALMKNVSGNNAVAVGDSALFNNTNTYGNVAVGSKALYAFTIGQYSTAIGYQSLFSATSAYSNSATGFQSMYFNTTGSYNTANGLYSLYDNTTGQYNTAVGLSSLFQNTTGSGNTALGTFADVSSAALQNATAVGYSTIVTASNQVMLGNTSVTSVKAAGSFVIFSDGRYKKDLKENVPGLDFINQLRPVTYHYDVHGMNDKMGVAEGRKQAKGKNGENDPVAATSNSNEQEEAAINQKEKKLYTGFVAQEVEAAARKLNYDFSGVYVPQNDKDIYGLSYADFVVPLVKGMQELSADNNAKKEKIDSLEARIEKLERLVNNSTSSGVALSNASLDQNAPNPVKNTTAIGYNLPQHFANAQIQITDAAGKLLNRVNLSGSGRGVLNLDALNLSAGTYHYTLLVDGRRIDSKKMIVVK